jgi:hypothetical protein
MVEWWQPAQSATKQNDKRTAKLLMEDDLLMLDKPVIDLLSFFELMKDTVIDREPLEAQPV